MTNYPQSQLRDSKSIYKALSSFGRPTHGFSRPVLAAVLASAALLGGCSSIGAQGPTANTGYGVPATDRTLSQRLLDKGIENTALTNINAIDPTLYQRSRIGVDSFYSEVLLTGEVPDTRTKQQILAIVDAMPDVKRVFDGLTIGVQKGTSYTVHDGYISSKLNAKIMANSAINSSQVKVVTDDGVVYVMGRLTPTQRGHLINIVESTVGVRRLMLLTQLIDNNGSPVSASQVMQEQGFAPPSFEVIDIADNTATTRANLPIVNTTNVNNAANINTSNINTAGVNTNNRGNQQMQPFPQTGATSTPVNTTDGPFRTTPNNTRNSTSNTQPITPKRSTGGSSYIELYKNQVPGWQ